MAKAHVLQAQSERLRNTLPLTEDELPTWRIGEVRSQVTQLVESRMKSGALKRPLVVLIEGWAVEVDLSDRFLACA